MERATAMSRRKLHVLTLVDRLSAGGGAEGIAFQLAMRLDDSRFDRTFCVTRWSPERARDPFASEAVPALAGRGVEFVGLERTSSLSLAAWRPLHRLMRQRPVDVLHSHMFGSNCWGAALGTIARTPVVVAHEHSWSFEGQPLRRFLDRHLIARRSDAFIAVSEEDRRMMIETEGIPAEKIVFVPNGIPDLTPPRDRDLRAELGIGPDEFIIGSVCVLRAVKALPLLIRAAASLSDEFPRLRVLIVGDGPERARIEALADELGIADRVSVLGFRTDVPDLLRILDVAVMCSSREGSPLSVMEYMEARLPIVATRVGGVPDLIEDGVEGRLVAPGDPLALAEAIARMLRDRPAAAAMGHRARERRRAGFRIETMVDRFADLYEELYARAISERSKPC